MFVFSTDCFICLGTRSIFIDIDDSGMPPTSSGLEKNLIMGVVYLARVEAMGTRDTNQRMQEKEKK